MQDNLISVSQAADEKRAGRATVYRAIKAGDLDTMEVAGRMLVVCNERWQKWEPNWVGARAARDLAEKQDSDNS